MSFTLAKFFALVLALAYVTLTFFFTGLTPGVFATLETIPGLGIILLAEGLASFAGPTGSGYVTSTPAIAISLFGWLTLIAVPLLTHFPPTALLH